MLVVESAPVGRGARESIWLILLSTGSAVPVATVLMFGIASPTPLLSTPVLLARGTSIVIPVAGSLGGGSCLSPLCQCVHSFLTPPIRIRPNTRITLRTSRAFVLDK